MSAYQLFSLSAIVTAVIWFFVAAFRSARNDRTWRAVAYLLIGSIPFFVAAWQADGRNAAQREQARIQGQITQQY